MSYIEKRNAVERDVDGDIVECSFSISIDKVWLNLFTEISGATDEVHLKKKAIVMVDMDLQWYVVFFSIIEATAGFFFINSASFYFLCVLPFPFILDSEDSDGRDWA